MHGFNLTYSILHNINYITIYEIQAIKLKKLNWHYIVISIEQKVWQSLP